MSTYARRHCLFCHSSQLELALATFERGYPHEHQSHQYTHEYLNIAICQQCGLVQLEQYSHDCWSYEGDEDWDMYWWYAIAPEDISQWFELLRACPERSNPSCECRTHQALRKASKQLSSKIRHAVMPDASTEFTWVQLDLAESGFQFRNT